MDSRMPHTSTSSQQVRSGGGGAAREATVLHRVQVQKLSYREDAWKPRVLEVTSDCELRYFGAEDEVLRGVITLSDCEVRGPCNYVDNSGNVVKHVMIFSAERSVSVVQGRWWIRRDYHFALASPQKLKELKMAIIRIKEKARTMKPTPQCDDDYDDGLDNDGTLTTGRARLSATQRLTSSLYNLMFKLTARQVPDSTSEIWMLGSSYDGAGGGTDRRKSMAMFARDVYSRLWFTYRKDFKPIEPSTWTSDTGWGCMLRCGQMMVAEALLRHYVGRSWRFHPLRPPPKEYVTILRYFEDDATAPFSIHKIAQFGQKSFGKRVGEWFGPNTVCQVIKFLFETGPIEEVAVHVPESTTIYRDEVRRLCCSRHAGNEGTEGFDLQGNPANSWRACIIMVPLRLGATNTLNTDYIPLLTPYLAFPQSLGFVGGKPRSSFYFVASRGASDVYYLDPHVTQEYMPLDQRCDTSTFHCEVLKRMPLSGLDPSLAVGFYCKSEAEFNDLCVRLIDAKNDIMPLIDVGDTRPEYRTPADRSAPEVDEDDWEDGDM